MQLTFLSEEPPASPSRSPVSEKDWPTLVATSCSPILPLLTDIGPDGWSGRTSPVCCQVTEDGILAPSSGAWRNSGMGSPTEFLTLSSSEFNRTLAPSPSDDAVCSLSDILETGDVPQRYYLSAKACQGILRRADKWGKKLPPLLQRALKAVANLVAHTLKAEGFDASEDGTGRGKPIVPIAYRTAGDGAAYEEGDATAPLTTGTDPSAQVLVYGFQPRIARNGRGDTGDVTGALNAQSGTTGKGDAAPHVAIEAHENWAVRRLTPTECLRLQGFPDDYFDRARLNKPLADGPKYKMLGNSMAVNVMSWIGQRIQLVEGIKP